MTFFSKPEIVAHLLKGISFCTQFKNFPFELSPILCVHQNFHNLFFVDYIYTRTLYIINAFVSLQKVRGGGLVEKYIR